MQNTYAYGIHNNLTPAELFFLIAVDKTMDELGVSDAAGIAMILAGSRFLSTRGKFAGAVKGTSVASKVSRSLLPYEIKYRILPTFTSWAMCSAITSEVDEPYWCIRRPGDSGSRLGYYCLRCGNDRKQNGYGIQPTGKT
ncbi:hypothetical protein BamMC406_2624 [Burkholderia ambifaria MC40-6]|uniref:Uncharacterized protein n=1 Tax=Burkholderia ambifaria (strain MC40-6) TaxID=398577 RepID=B1YWD3_BURA4|nr:hypothetical protein BamMC406_2624 [Burkholderia ambifaria MC40-6]